jgi:hypothetical protein
MLTISTNNSSRVRVTLRLAVYRQLICLGDKHLPSHTDSCPLSTTVSTSRFLGKASTEGDSSASRTQVLLPQTPVQNSLSTNNLTNWVPGWRPFHVNLLVFSSQADFNWQLKSLSLTSYFTSLHSTEMLTISTNNSSESELLYDWRFTAN